MRRDTISSVTYVVALFGLLAPSAAFVPPTTSRCSHAVVPLNLVPGQGHELVAAFNAATCPDEDEGQARLHAVAAVAPADASRSFVKRAFSLPSHKKKGLLPEQQQQQQQQQQQDVVYFPVTGFTFFRHGDRVIPLPNKSHVSCPLPTTNPNEELYGWFNQQDDSKLDLTFEDPGHTHQNRKTAVTP